MIEQKDWRWFGNAAHLCVGQWCRFHLATEIGGYLVSTVGEYWPDRSGREIHAEIHDPAWLIENSHRKGDDFDAAYARKFGYETIGCDRTFETMVFKIGSHCAAEGCNCGLPIPADHTELDFAGYNTAGDATQGHMAMCEKWANPAAIPEGVS